MPSRVDWDHSLTTHLQTRAELCARVVESASDHRADLLRRV